MRLRDSRGTTTREWSTTHSRSARSTATTPAVAARIRALAIQRNNACVLTHSTGPKEGLKFKNYGRRRDTRSVSNVVRTGLVCAGRGSGSGAEVLVGKALASTPGPPPAKAEIPEVKRWRGWIEARGEFRPVVRPKELRTSTLIGVPALPTLWIPPAALGIMALIAFFLFLFKC